jgi:hypothetical protein
MKEGRHKRVSEKYFCDLFKHDSCNATAYHPESRRKKKRDAFKHLSKVAEKETDKSNGNCQHIIPKIFCEQVVDRLIMQSTIRTPRHD